MPERHRSGRRRRQHVPRSGTTQNSSERRTQAGRSGGPRAQQGAGIGSQHSTGRGGSVAHGQPEEHSEASVGRAWSCSWTGPFSNMSGHSCPRPPLALPGSCWGPEGTWPPASSTHLHQLQLPVVRVARLRARWLQEHDAHLVALGAGRCTVRAAHCPGSAMPAAHPAATTLLATCSSTSGLLSTGVNTSPRWLSECSS